MNGTKTINKTWAIFLLACVCCFLWGSATPSIKTGYELFHIAQSDTWSIILFAGIRFFIAGLLVVLFESLRNRRPVVPSRDAVPSIVALALAQTIIQYFFFYIGLAHTSGVTGTILSGSGGVLSIILVCLVLRTESVTANKIVGVILAHHAGAAERKKLQTEQRVADLLSDQGRPQTEGKLIHPDSVCLGQGKVPQLMEEDQAAQNNDGGNNGCQHSLTPERASLRASARLC